MNIMGYFEPDEDINILNTQYVKAYKDESTGKWSDDYLYIVYRDNKTGEKKLKTVTKPKTEIFFTAPEHRSDFKTQRTYIPKDNSISKISRYNKISKTIMNEISEDGVDTEILKVAKSYPKEAFKWRHSYFADYNICDYALIAHAINNLDSSVTNTKVTTAYLDIESDVYGLSNNEMDDGVAPMNAVSVAMPYDENGKAFDHPRVYTLLLRNYALYKDQEYFETHLDKFKEECDNEFAKKYNSPKYIIKLYDDEVILFKNLFALLHKMRPDFIAIWNMSYDIPTMITRLKYLGEEPANYFCHHDFAQPYYRYNYDLKYKNDFKNKTESFDCTSYSCWIDQMLNYAGIRKSFREYGGNSLDNVAGIELKAEKRRFSKKSVTVMNAAREEYWNFVKYSINDVLLQYGIDKKTEDTQTLFDQAIYGGTRIHKALKQSVYLKNVFYIEYLKLDIIPRNNNNVNYTAYKNETEALMDNDTDPDEIRLAGALVGNPTLNDNSGMYLYKNHDEFHLTHRDRSNHLFEYAVDMDFKAMYPNVKSTSNISESTQIGRIIIDEQILPDENPLNEEKFMRASKFTEDFESGDCILLGKWLRLPSVKDLIKDYKSDDEEDNDKLQIADDGRVVIRKRGVL